MPDSPEPNIYQLRVVLLGISPIIWRRLLVRGDSTIADLHDILQISFGWSDNHLHRFLIHGKQYGVAYLGGITLRNDPRRIKLSDLGLRVKEKFLYEYDFNDQRTLFGKIELGSPRLFHCHRQPQPTRSFSPLAELLVDGNVFKALRRIEHLEADLEDEVITGASSEKLRVTLQEFQTYIENNQQWIPNYGELWRAGETISTAFVESAVDQVLSKRFVKKQQMSWSRRGAHLLLQVRTRVLNEELRGKFESWYPGLGGNSEECARAA
jgi:hypothetical protein